eukprot:TRINITY_DN2952_c0_g1_i10.p1 TRINITY_DN2952_c0_g1~~TRINITY_DN2952_c0_g1_i10.p1  ORF type:complete len:132 (-),score=22.96 TRINITY_DN2952_c0_g1_i10:252-647(-)
MFFILFIFYFFFFFFQAEDGIRDAQESRGLGDVYKRQGVASNLLQRGTFDVNQSTPLTSVWLSGAGPPPSVTANLAHRAPLSSSGHSTPRPQPSATPRRPNTSASTATSRSSTSNQPPASVSNSRLIQWTF